MTGLFAFTLFLGAGLLFLLQPICAKMLLPILGGTPAVWKTCMVFFQAGLLAGYAYAHAGPRLLGAKRHVVCHLLLLAAALWSLPVAITRDVAPPSIPVLWLLQTLTLAAGLPFFAVAACGPLLQRWYGGVRSASDP